MNSFLALILLLGVVALLRIAFQKFLSAQAKSHAFKVSQKSNNEGVFRFSRIFCAAAQLFAVAAVVCAGNADYRARFQAANGAHEPEQAEAILNEWKAARPGDPEYYIAAANFVLNQESSVSISTKTAGPGDFVVADQKTGREVGSISTSAPSTAAYQQAIGLLKKALSKAPARIDIYLGLATLYQDSGGPGELVKELSAMAGYANQHPGTLLYKDGKPYPEPARENLSHAINNFARRCFEAGTKQGDETFHSLAQLAVNAFPDREVPVTISWEFTTAQSKRSRGSHSRTTSTPSSSCLTIRWCGLTSASSTTWRAMRIFNAAGAVAGDRRHRPQPGHPQGPRRGRWPSRPRRGER